MKLLNKLLLLYLCSTLLISSSSNGQNVKQLIHSGNKKYEQQKFREAENDYKKSLEKKKTSLEGNYNLGDALYGEGKYEDASKQFETVKGLPTVGNKEKSMNFHNLGNSYLKQNKFPESIDAYKNALKLNPKDNDTRYNLAYAQAKLQQQQQQQNQKKDNKENKDKKENQKQNKPEDKKQDKKQKQDQAEKEKNKITKDDADKILQALNNDEKKVQKKLNQKEATKVTIEKQW